MFYKNSTAKLNYCKCTLELSRKSLDIKIGAPGKSILTPSDNLKKWLWNFTKNRGKNLKSVIHDSHMKNLHVLKVVPPARFERAAPGLGILRSILLSYGDMCMFQESYILQNLGYPSMGTSRWLPVKQLFVH